MSSGHDRRGRGRARSARVLHERRGAAIANRFRVRLAMTLDGYRPTDHTPRLSLVLRARYASCAVGATADRPAWAMPFGDSFALSYRIHEGLFARHKREISEASTLGRAGRQTRSCPAGAATSERSKERGFGRGLWRDGRFWGVGAPTSRNTSATGESRGGRFETRSPDDRRM